MVHGSVPGYFTISALSIFLLVIIKSGVTVASLHNYHPDLDRNTGKPETEEWKNPKVNPCDNFYQFVCGNTTRSRLETSTTQDEINQFLITSLKKNSSDETDNIGIIKSAKSLFRTCVKTNMIYNGEVVFPYGYLWPYILDHLSTIGGWPVLLADSWNETSFDWKRVILKVNSDSSWLTGLFPFKPSMTPDKTPYFAEPDLGFDIDDLLRGGLKNANISAQLKDAIRNAIQLNVSRSLAKSDLTKVVEFEISLAHIFKEHQSNDSKTTNVTLRQLKDDFPFFPCDDFIARVIYPSSHVRIHPDQRLTFVNYNFIKDYYEFIGKTDKRVLANYLAWRELESMSKLMKYLEWVEFVFTQKTATDERCLSIVDRLLPHALETLYVRESLDRNTWQEKIQTAETIAKSVQQDLLKMIRDANWLTGRARDMAVKNLELVTFKFGYSDELYNGTMLGDYYRSLEINESSIFDSVVRVDRVFRYQFAGEANADHNDERSTNLLGFQAGYNRETNRVEIPLGLFGDRFLRHGGGDSQSSNYGQIAFVIGRELGTSLVNHKRRTWNTTKRNIFVESPEDYVEYKRRVQCLRQHYKHIYDAVPVLDQVPNDIGYRAAHETHKRVMIKENNYQLFEGKTYDWNQIFWINTASFHCTKKSSFKRTESATVTGAFSNIQQFADDFHCPVNSTMNPLSKCYFI